jgi:hypothetical protein
VTQVAAWLEPTARRVVDRQLGEAARINSKARELVGFIGLVLGLLATAASQSGGARGLWGGLFRGFAIVAVGALLSSAIHVVRRLVLQRPEFRDIGAAALRSYLYDPDLPTMGIEEIQARASYDLTVAAETNAPLIEEAHAAFAADFGFFAIGLGTAGLAIVALILALT